MEKQIIIECIPPKHTAQASNRILKTKDGKYFVGKKSDSRAKQTQNELFMLLYPHKPEKPLEGALKVKIKWVYPFRKSEPKKNRINELWCDTRPDIDNLCKLLFDMMTRIGFWIDDSQIASLEFCKCWSDKPRIELFIKEL
jgi:Holliday junction resolvase RusA-like endonuclease